MTFNVFRNEYGKAEFAMQVVRDTKNMTLTPEKRPEHSVHEGLEPRPLFCNPVLTVLARAIAENTFRDYSTMEELLEIEEPEDEMYHLRQNESVLGKPFFHVVSIGDYPIPPSHELGSYIFDTSLLAVDHSHEMFAVTLPEKTKSGKVTTKLAIMDVSHPEPLFITNHLAPVTNLLPAKSKRGFYTIDTNAEIRTFAPQIHIPPALPSRPKDTAVTPRGINGILGPSRTSDMPGKKSGGLLDLSIDTILADSPSRSRDHDAVIVSADKLAAVFGTGASSAFSMPPVMELFERVVSLSDGKVD